MIDEGLKWLVLTPFTRFGYEKLARFLRSINHKLFVPLPRDLCLVSNKVNLPRSFMEIWGPLIDFLREGMVFAECYLNLEDLLNQINHGLDITLLVFKYKVYGKIDTLEWLSKIPSKLDVKINNWSGLLVIDRFVDYMTLIKSGVNLDKLLAVDVFAPTPLEVLVLTVNNLLNWECSIESIIHWIIKYIGEIVLFSSDISNAYLNLIRDPSYRDLINKCMAENYMVNW